MPAQHRELLIRLYHDISHPGTRETLKKLGVAYYWPKIRSDVADYVSKCVPCNSCKPHKVIRPPLDTRPIIMPRFHDVQIDVIGPLPVSENMRYCLTVLDKTSRYFDAIPMAEANTTECARAFIRQWVSHFGLPVRAGSDNGNVFISNLWTKMHEELGTIVAYSPLYSSQSLGGVERQHKDLKQSLKATLLAMGDVHQSRWMSVLPWTLLARRTAFHSELQASPADARAAGRPQARRIMRPFPPVGPKERCNWRAASSTLRVARRHPVG